MTCRSLLLIIHIIFFAGISKSQDLEFYAEKLTFKIFDSIFHVDGTYYLCNVGSGEIKQLLYYPFPVDSQYYGEIDLISISRKDSLINIIRKDKGGIYFALELGPYESTEYKIYYKQPLYKNRAEYILETTKKWRKPFETANYKLIFPDNLQINNISYEPDSIQIENDSIIYLWHKKNFMPDRNMIIEF